MTALDWALWFAVLFCCALPFVIRRYIRRVRIHSVFRPSIHLPERPFLCADLVLNRKPCNGVAEAWKGWCTDCGWAGSMGHALDCPQLTGEICPRCAKPKRTQHVCHYCGFAGFVIIFGFPQQASLRLPAGKSVRLVSEEVPAAASNTANEAKDSSPLSCEDFEVERSHEA
jgi:hypothetical protein